MSLGDLPDPTNRAQRRAADRQRRRRKGVAVATGASVVLSGLGVSTAAPASADPVDFRVTTGADSSTADPSAVTLREALANAQNTPGFQTITFDSTVHDVAISDGQISFSYDADGVTIQGPGRSGLTIHPASNFNGYQRLFYFAYDDGPVTVSGLTISGSRSGNIGGAVRAAYTDLTLSDVVLADNSAQGNGGALHFTHGDLTMTDTAVTGNTGGVGGGAYARYATVAMTRVDISDNTSDNNGGGAALYDSAGSITASTVHHNDGFWGGGLAIWGEHAGAFEISSTTIDTNHTVSKGGGLVLYGGSTSVRDSTISGNTSDHGAGGVYAGNDSVDIERSTITGNVATGDGGGVQASSRTRNNVNGTTSSVAIVGSIVSGNTAATHPDVATFDYLLASSAPLHPAQLTATYSLIGDVGNTGVDGSHGNLLGVDPMLAALANNGGRTQTHLPAVTSPVKDAGDPTFTSTGTDQRGLARVVDRIVDMGAVELAAPPAPAPVFIPPTTTTTAPPTTTPPTTAPPTTTPPAAPPAPPSVPTGGSSPVFEEDGVAQPVPLPPSAPPNQVTAAMALSPTESIAVTGDGRVFTTTPGDNHGGIPAGKKLNAPIVGLGIHWTLKPKTAGFEGAAHADEWEPTGYWLLAADGGVFSFGTATFHGSTGARKLNAPIVGLTPTATGQGYYLVASDGGVFSFGDARFFGSTGGRKLAKPIVSMVPTSTGKGYLLVAADGGVFTFGDARFVGSGATTGKRFVGAIATDTGLGYWLLTSDGKRLPYGDAK